MSKVKNTRGYMRLHLEEKLEELQGAPEDREQEEMKIQASLPNHGRPSIRMQVSHS